MWTKIFLQLLICATSILAAEPTDLCYVNFEGLKKVINSKSEKVLREVDLGFAIAQADAQKLDEVVSEKLANLDRNMIDRDDLEKAQINELKTTLLAEFKKGEKNVISKIEALSSTLEAGCANSEQIVKGCTSKFEIMEQEMKALKTSLMAEMNSRFEKVGDQLTNIPGIKEKADYELKLANATEKIKERDESNEELKRKIQEMENKIKDCGQKLVNVTEEMKIKIVTEKCQKARKLSLTRVESGVYYFDPSKNGNNWREGKNFCLENGMQLATFGSVQEMKNLFDADPKKGQKYLYWVDVSDIGQSAGHFVWADGTKVDATFWDKDKGQPDQSGPGKETCGGLSFYNPKLFDGPCNDKYSFICKLAEQDLPCLATN